MKLPLNKLSFSALLLAGALNFSAFRFSGMPGLGTHAGSGSMEAMPKALTQWELPAELREVSAIALLQNNLMACVQDEEGAIYLYDLDQKKVKDKIQFAGPGDYEGIALKGTTAFILRSDGAILEIADFMGGNPATKEHKTILAATQNTEGLAYDEKNNRLLIACKGYDEKLGDNKGIYAFTLDDKKMQNQPVITIPLAQETLISKSKKKKDKYAVFQPSSLEVHPTTGDLYVLDAVNSRLLILNEDGSIKKAFELDEKHLIQAEGLSFGSNGDLYIASEGSKKGKGIIVKYAPGV